jgi:NAD-dependent SIR2 family protein deacetylase
VAESDALLVIGSSLMVFSAFRLATFARDLKIPIAVLNQGETRIDSFEGLVKHEAPIGETMAKILKCISL